MKRTVLAVVAVLALAGCGSSSDPGGLDAEYGNYPDCSAVWVKGKKLPADYDGCLRKAGDDSVIELGASIACRTGSDLYTYEPPGGAFFTDAAGRIIDGGENYASHPKYVQRFEECG